MNKIKKTFIVFIYVFFTGMLTGCFVPKNHLSLDQRSMVIPEKATETEVLSKARVEAIDDPDVNNIKILHLKGTPYEMGFQHGRLIQEDIKKIVNRVAGIAKILASEDMMDEVYDLMEPYIPLEEKEEMRGLAHGADIPLRVIHWYHCIPEVSEYGQNKKFLRPFHKYFFKSKSCSNIVAYGKATSDGEMYQIRVLDWMRQVLKVQEYPVILVHKPDIGNASVTFGYAGFIGCISGMNDQHMAFGEMGYGDSEEESLEGKPFPFLFRELMRKSGSVDEAVKIIKQSRRTCSYAYMISDAKNNEAVSLITNRGEVIVEKTDLGTGKSPFVEDAAYRGYYNEKIYQLLSENKGRINEKVLMDISKQIGMENDNMQNVIFKPGTLEAWITNAGNAKKDEAGQAYNQKWFYYDFKKAFQDALPE
ncbi:MAG: hypothetical protein GY749_32930 [Desulfobacteraceae bacterium]|nr:hypothetical protein [Desulfobacteraceae bacterium]